MRKELTAGHTRQTNRYVRPLITVLVFNSESSVEPSVSACPPHVQRISNHTLAFVCFVGLGILNLHRNLNALETRWPQFPQHLIWRRWRASSYASSDGSAPCKPTITTAVALPVQGMEATADGRTIAHLPGVCASKHARFLVATLVLNVVSGVWHTIDISTLGGAACSCSMYASRASMPSIDRALS
jgi:hypothetical protein